VVMCHTRDISPKFGEVLGLTLFIPLGLGSITRVDGLPYLPYMDHGEVLGGFYVRFTLGSYLLLILFPTVEI